VEGGNDEVLEHLDLVRVDQRLVDLERLQVALAADRDLDHAAAGGAVHLDGFEARLHLGHLGLHLLRLLHHLAEISHDSSSPSGGWSALGSSAAGAGAASPSGGVSSRTASMVAPGKVSITARTSGCSSAALRRSRLWRSASSRSVGAPGALETLT